MELYDWINCKDEFLSYYKTTFEKGQHYQTYFPLTWWYQDHTEVTDFPHGLWWELNINEEVRFTLEDIQELLDANLIELGWARSERVDGFTAIEVIARTKSAREIVNDR